METKDLIGLFGASVIQNVGFMLVVPFLPLELDGYGVRDTTLGFIFSIYSVASMLGSLIIGRVMILFGRKTILLVGVTTTGLAMVMFGAIKWFEDPSLVVAICLMSRAIQGIGSSMTLTTSFAIISISYGEKKQKYLGYLEAAQGFGCILGPSVGGVMYSFLGFSKIFNLIGGSLILLVPILYLQIPKSIDGNAQLQKQHHDKSQCQESLVEIQSREEEISEIINNKPTYLKLLRMKKFIFVTCCGFLYSFGFSYYYPVLPIRLKDFNLAPTTISFFFTVAASAYLFSSTILMSVIIAAGIDDKKIMVGSLLLYGLSEFMMGPSYFLPDSEFIIILGLLLGGLNTIFVMVSTLTSMVHEAEIAFPTQKDYVNDLCSGIFNFTINLGLTLGPLYGTTFTSLITYQSTCTSTGILLISYCLLYYLFFTPSSKPILTQELQLKEAPCPRSFASDP
ncbi:unnamed protein product [Moneuplotes crassus]|uniref:Major facilitator superfamily (MFS) profile domain-containing protein n=1 Tax=Euplotes crassus TaxID=5936 RepID=A0AAD1UBQ9_EUPCR|nr:unnamed protein product [Moneuplotes crassus]